MNLSILKQRLKNRSVIINVQDRRTLQGFVEAIEGGQFMYLKMSLILDLDSNNRKLIDDHISVNFQHKYTIKYKIENQSSSVLWRHHMSVFCTGYLIWAHGTYLYKKKRYFCNLKLPCLLFIII